MEVVVFTSGIKIKQFIKIFMKTAKEVDKTTNIPRVITYSTHVKCGDNYLKTKQIIVSFMFTKELTSLNEIEEFLQQNNMSFIYIYQGRKAMSAMLFYAIEGITRSLSADSFRAY